LFHALLALSCALWLGACAGSGRTLPSPETPDQISAQIDRASLLVRDAQRLEVAGHEQEAMAKYQQAIGLYRELPAAWNNLGSLMMKNGNNLGAAEAFMTASEMWPTDPRPLHNLGTLWESLGYLDDAARWYGEALKRKPDNLPSLRRIVIVEQIRNKPDATTLEYIRKALLLENDPWWQNTFRRAKVRFEDLITTAKSDSMSR
jgi:tetratricopeptide (TPR) repeat protein